MYRAESLRLVECSVEDLAIITHFSCSQCFLSPLIQASLYRGSNHQFVMKTLNLNATLFQPKLGTWPLTCSPHCEDQHPGQLKHGSVVLTASPLNIDDTVTAFFIVLRSLCAYWKVHGMVSTVFTSSFGGLCVVSEECFRPYSGINHKHSPQSFPFFLQSSSFLHFILCPPFPDLIFAASPYPVFPFPLLLIFISSSCFLSPLMTTSFMLLWVHTSSLLLFLPFLSSPNCFVV